MAKMQTKLGRKNLTIDVGSNLPLSQSVDFSYQDKKQAGARQSPMSFVTQNICDKSVDGGAQSKMSRNFLMNIAQADMNNSLVRDSISSNVESKAIHTSLSKPTYTRRTDADTARGGALETEDSKDFGYA